jgi:hypothetical protein
MVSGSGPRTRLNEFLVDLVEFLQKHFAVPVDRTRIDDEGERIHIVLRHTPSDSRLEIEATPAGASFRFGGAAWTVDAGEGGEAGRSALRAAVLRETLALLLGRTVVLAVRAGGETLEARVVREREADAGTVTAASRSALPEGACTTRLAWGLPATPC